MENQTDISPDLKPKKTPREQWGWRLMLLGFAIILGAGIAFYAVPRTGNPAYGKLGNSLMALGLIVYVFGRVFRWRGKSARSDRGPYLK